MVHVPNTTLITTIEWGYMKVSVNDQTFQFKDCKVWPGGAKEWNWNLTGTRHRPGIQPEDIEEILVQGIEVMVLSRGMELRLGICAETEQVLQERGIAYHFVETNQAVQLFNELMEQGKRVGGIFHSTC